MEKNNAASSPSCWKIHYDEHKGLFDNLKDQFQEFIDTPFKEHKDCFKLTLDRMIDKYSTKTTSAEKEMGNHSTDLQPPAASKKRFGLF